ncbi:glycoside hydrolase [Lindgomyces ingoldianus]|uniref:Glycoside hydrolase n=1 Tax=Lindgomyces ingoldianus TaxID=673940 RepID=A0ACB6QW68_9PLEO|nr:glycoside hydrolase [Lindgomyces ingoldianus]KAF2471120.1 glycoside hydrolase [Lindgomyces ingoldianus]
MIFWRVISAALVLGSAFTAPAEKRGVAFSWGSEKLRGVNIGGWLVLEPWITPSVFESLGRSDVVDEYTLGQKLGHDAALAILRKHWDTWATWQDFNKIKQSGFNVVRIPIGYWAYDTFGAPYVQGAAAYIDAAIDWSRGLGLKIIIDLHGAPGSQNGYDNSGERLANPTWQSGDTVKQTLQVLKTISEKYAQTKYQDVVIGIQLLNEPLIVKLNEAGVRQFYRDGFGQVRTVSDTPVILHDGFKPPNTWNTFLTPSDNNAQNVAIDHHEYQVFSPEQVAMQPWQHRQAVCNNAESYNGADKWTFVGEWTGAMTDCAKYLNGFGVGARYDGTYPGSSYVGTCGFQNDITQWPQTYKDDTRGYIEAQMMAFEKKTQGWFFWNFKTEGAAEWDAFRLIDAGVFPQPLDKMKFGAICTNF